jgi:hypothetical protein
MTCAFGPCACFAHPVCTVNQRFPAKVRCDVLLEDGRCRFIAGHEGDCKSDSGSTKPSTNATRDGDPKLAAARERKHPMFVKRHRAGPHWIPPERRV